MNIKDAPYAENKAITLQKLEAFYMGGEAESNSDAEVNSASSAEQQDTQSPYAETENKISLYAEEDDVVYGRLVGHYDETTNAVRIEVLHIEALSRGKRVGSLLVEAFEQQAREKGVGFSFVDTTSSSAPRFYEKLGYELVGQMSDYPMQGETYYYYAKRLFSTAV